MVAEMRQAPFFWLGRSWPRRGSDGGIEFEEAAADLNSLTVGGHDPDDGWFTGAPRKEARPENAWSLLPGGLNRFEIEGGQNSDRLVGDVDSSGRIRRRDADIDGVPRVRPRWRQSDLGSELPPGEDDAALAGQRGVANV